MKKPNIILLLLMVLTCLTACHKDKEMNAKDPVVSNVEMTVSETQARFSWQVDFAGQFQTGVEVSQNENMADLRRVEASKEEDKFVAVVDSLTEATNYYYRFVVWNKFGSSEQSVGNFKTMETPPTPGQDTTYYDITVSVNIPESGTATGGGRFAEGDTCRVMATVNAGYNFVNWTENGEQVSSEEEYTFTVIGNRDLVANFMSQQYTITVSASPTDGGSVTGGGTYYEGEQCTVTATANTGYAFMEWCEIIGDSTGGIEVSVSSDADYTFTVNSDRTLVAKFIELPQAPEGAIDGKFTINDDGVQVYFSQGNLQYIGSASTPYWKFADNQWDVLGTTTGQNSSNQAVDRDLFGWGTSGYNHGAVCYQPWSTSQTNSDYYAYGDYQYNLYDQTGQADWGYNPISNGGGQAGQWRTLTKDEWVWVLGPNSNPNPGTNCRTSSTVNGTANARFAKAKVNNLHGVILFPDSYTHPIGVAQPVGINETGNTGWDGNNYSTTDFGLMQDNGAVFLPAAGIRSGTSVNSVGSRGYYWSASCSNSDYAYYVLFDSGYLNPSNYSSRYNGRSVRLVAPVEN